MQLPPTRATPLSTPPSSVLSTAGILNPRAQHGLDLFWHKTKEVIIFKDQVRCLDAWWLEVIDECTPGFEANVGQG